MSEQENAEDTPVDTRREALEAAMREVEERPTEPQDSEPEDEAVIEPETAELASDVAEEPVEDSPTEDEPQPWAAPPQSWKKDTHEVWGTLDDKAKSYIWQREEEMRKGVETLIPKAKFADTISAVMEPHMETIRGLGAEPAQAVKALMEVDRTLRFSAPEQKKAYFLELGKSYGITISTEDGQTIQTAPPEFSQVQNELLSVKATLASIQEASAKTEALTLKQQIDAFAKENPYFDDVKEDMIKLLNGGVAIDLKDAYEKSIRLNEGVFSQVQKSQQAKLDREKRDSANRAAQAAKAAAVSVKSSTPGVQAPTKAQDRRSTLSELFSEVDGRL